MGFVHRPQGVIRAIAGEGGKHLNPHTLEEIHHHFLVALDVVLTHIVDDVIAGDNRLNGADFLVNPGNVDFVVPTRLARAGKARRVTNEDVHLRAFIHDLLGDSGNIVTD